MFFVKPFRSYHWPIESWVTKQSALCCTLSKHILKNTFQGVSRFTVRFVWKVAFSSTSRDCMYAVSCAMCMPFSFMIYWSERFSDFFCNCLHAYISNIKACELLYWMLSRRPNTPHFVIYIRWSGMLLRPNTTPPPHFVLYIRWSGMLSGMQLCSW